MLCSKCLCPLKSILETLTAQEMVFGGGVFGRWLAHEGGALTSGISVLVEASLVAQRLNCLPAMQETRFDPGLGRSPGEGNGNPLQYSCLENPHGQRSLVGYSPWDHKEWDRTEWLHTHTHTHTHTRELSYLLSAIWGNKMVVFNLEKNSRPEPDLGLPASGLWGINFSCL